jgi:hypothetical protein
MTLLRASEQGPALPERSSGRRALRKRCLTCYIVAITIAAVTTIFLTTWWLASGALNSVREQAERSLQQEASEIATFVDREIVNAQNVLVALASSPFLEGRHFEAFHKQASQVAKKLGMQIVLSDRHVESQILNTAVAWGAKLTPSFPQPRQAAQAELLRSAQPTVSNLFWAPIVKRYIVAVLVPVLASGKDEIEYILSVGIPAERFREIIQLSSDGSERNVSILDRDGVIVARSERNLEFLGKRIFSTSPEQLKSRPPRGVVKDSNIEGIPYSWGYV